MAEPEAILQPGVAFRLQPDGQWKPEKIPPDVLKSAKFSGYLTIQGYRCTVFETPDKNQWAQKSTGTPATATATVASRIAARWLRAQQDITTQVNEKLERDGDDKKYDKAIVDFVNKTRDKLPPIDKALEKAADILLKTREKIEHKHPKVQDHYVQMFLQELAQKHRELEDMRRQLMRGLTVELDRYESEANVVE